MFLDFAMLKRLAEESNPLKIADIINAEAWYWFTNHYHEQVGTVWMAVRVHNSDLHGLFVTLFDAPPTEKP